MTTNSHSPAPFHPPNAGFSLIEAVFTMAVAATMLIAALSMLGSAARSRRVLSTRRLAPALARQWLTEILQADYDDIDDALDDATIDGWSRRVVVEHVKRSDPNVVTGSDEGIKRVTVTATDSEGRSTSLTSLRSSTSVYDQPPPRATTYVGWVGAAMQIGPRDATRMSTGTHLLNLVPATGQ